MKKGLSLQIKKKWFFDSLINSDHLKNNNQILFTFSENKPFTIHICHRFIMFQMNHGFILWHGDNEYWKNIQKPYRKIIIFVSIKRKRTIDRESPTQRKSCFIFFLSNTSSIYMKYRTKWTIFPERKSSNDD